MCHYLNKCAILSVLWLRREFVSHYLVCYLSVFFHLLTGIHTLYHSSLCLDPSYEFSKLCSNLYLEHFYSNVLFHFACLNEALETLMFKSLEPIQFSSASNFNFRPLTCPKNIIHSRLLDNKLKNWKIFREPIQIVAPDKTAWFISSSRMFARINPPHFDANDPWKRSRFSN